MATNLIDYLGKNSDIGSLWSTVNNLWSAVNNRNQDNAPEAFRSFIFEMLDVIEAMSEHLDDTHKRKLGYQKAAGFAGAAKSTNKTK